MTRPRICVVTAVPITVTAFLRNHLRALSEYADVAVVSDFRERRVDLPAGVRALQAEIPRAIRPAGDLRALAHLYRLMRRERFTAVQSVTPKAGLLGMMAARLCGVPLRVHWFTGQVWATRRGAMRALLKTADRFIAGSATHVLVDSASQRDFLRAEGVLGPDAGFVIGQGSIAGVDTQRFRPDDASRARLRAQLRASVDDVIVLYVGRLNRDKGILVLARAFADAAKVCPSLRLWLVGPDEERLEGEVKRLCSSVSERVHLAGYTDCPEACMAAADVFCLPSYREGFGSVVVEAAACGIPAVGSSIYGLTDAIEDGVTGALFPVGDAEALAARLVSLGGDGSVRHAMGQAARRRALERFEASYVTAGLLEYYRRTGVLPSAR